jgi:Mg-chelatase subunit ChlD
MKKKRGHENLRARKRKSSGASGQKKKIGKGTQKFSQTKKGISAIVVAMILVAMVLILIALIYSFVSRIIEEDKQKSELLEAMNLEIIDIEKVQFNSITQSAIIQIVKRGGVQVRNESASSVLGEGEEFKGDFFSVVDISGSMRTCADISRACCESLDDEEGIVYAYYIGGSSGHCDNLRLNDEAGCLNECGGTMGCFGTCNSGIWADRLTPMQNANEELIDYLLGYSTLNRIGLIAYSTSVVLSGSNDLTQDDVELKSKIDSWVSGGNTCLCCGINEGWNRFTAQSSSEREKIMIVMSDGEANIGCVAADGSQDAINAACNAKAAIPELTIHAVGIGEAGETTMRAIATCGGGNYYAADDVGILTNLYLDIAAYSIKSTAITKHRINYLSFVFYNATDSYKEKTDDLPDILQIKSYSFNLQGKISNVIRVEIFPVGVTESGAEIIGSMLDSEEISEKANIDIEF